MQSCPIRLRRSFSLAGATRFESKCERCIRTYTKASRRLASIVRVLFYLAAHHSPRLISLIHAPPLDKLIRRLMHPQTHLHYPHRIICLKPTRIIIRRPIYRVFAQSSLIQIFAITLPICIQFVTSFIPPFFIILIP